MSNQPNKSLFANRLPSGNQLFSNQASKHLNQEQLITVMAKVVEQISKRKLYEQSTKIKEVGKSQNKQQEIKRIVITNERTISCSKYGEQFKSRLDSRDQMMEHKFKFEIDQESDLQSKIKTKGLLKTQLWENIKIKIQEFLVDVIENVSSVSFNLLDGGKLKDSECKDYASKNILINVHSVFRQTISALLNENIINKAENDNIFESQADGNKLTMQKFSFHLSEFIDGVLMQTLSNISPYYPQAPPSGGTLRMRQVISPIDRSANEQMDFLYLQNLIIKTNSGKGDHTSYIMNVINRAIAITGQQDPNDKIQKTTFQKFLAFSQNLFWLAQYGEHKSKFESQNQHSHNRRKKKVGVFNQLFKESIQKQTKKSDQEMLIFLKKEIVSLQKDDYKLLNENKYLNDPKRSQRIQQMRNKGDFQIGQKLSSSMKTFSSSEIKDKNFSNRESSVLRILTKWAQNLQSIFENPQQYTTNRIYPFKTFTNDIVYLNGREKEQLKEKIINKEAKLKKIQMKLRKKMFEFHGLFLSQEKNQNLMKYIKRYTETRMLASRMNYVLINIMKNYVSELIQMLINVGKIQIKAEERKKFNNQNISNLSEVKIKSKPIFLQINLITLKIGDLMRSKIHCSQASFIQLLKTLYILDEANSIENPFFQLVRIKNKLDTKDNNILINYLFLGKIQCELQMSIQNIAKKDQHYYSFRHFLYELTRGKYGVLSQCATVISQYDPIVSSENFELYYEPNKLQKHTKKQKQFQKQGEKQQKQIKQKLILNEQINQTITNIIYDTLKGDFICKKCRQVKMQANFISQKTKICRECELKLQPNKFNLLDIKSQKSKVIQEIKKKIDILTQFTNYQQIQTLKKPYFMITVNSKNGKITIKIIDYERSDSIYYSFLINVDLWQNAEFKNNQNLDIQIQNITSLINHKNKVPNFSYIVCVQKANQLQLIFKQYFKRTESDHTQYANKIKDRVINLINSASKKLRVKSIENLGTSKSQSLQFNQNKSKYYIMEKLIQNKKQMISNILKNIQYISAESLGLYEVPGWMQLANKLKFVNLSNNKLKNLQGIQDEKTQSNIIQLVLHNNEIDFYKTNWKVFGKLKSLNLRNNNIKAKKIQTAFLPQNIETLDMSFNYLQQFQITDSNTSKLKKLKLESNRIPSINYKLPNNLTHLDLSDNCLKFVNFGHISTKKVLCNILLSNNYISQAILQSKYIESIDLSKNKIKHFQTKDCINIKSLNLDDNSLSSVCINDYLNLQILNLSGNFIDKLKLHNLPCLRVLQINNNLHDKYDEEAFQIYLQNHNPVNLKCQNAQLIRLFQNKFKIGNLNK